MRPCWTRINGPGTRIRRRGARLAIAAAGAFALVGPASAYALGNEASAQPASTQAGANSNLSINVAFSNAGDDVKKIVISLPPGQVGNPNAAPTCSVAQLNADTCPAASAVGAVTTNLNAFVVVIPVPLSAPGTLYNLQPQPGEPARFGIVLRPLGGLLGKVVLQSAVEVRSDDFGLNTIIDNIPRTAPPLIPGVDVPIDITSMAVNLQGQAGSPPQGFLRNPTSCQEATTRFSATSYDGATATTPATDEDSYTPTGCDSVPFSPEFSASIGAPGFTALATKPPLTSVIQQSIEEAGLQTARVILPTNIGSDLGALVPACPVPAFEAGTCPAATVIGSAIATSPLLSAALAGPVVVVSNPSGLPRIGLDLLGQLHLQLYGNLVISAAGTGVEFAGLPDIPIASFALKFSENRLALNQVDLCDGAARIFTTEFLAHSGATLNGTKAATLVGCGPSKGNGKGKGATGAKKCKKKGKKRKGKAAAAKKKKKKCKRKKRKKK